MSRFHRTLLHRITEPGSGGSTKEESVGGREREDSLGESGERRSSNGEARQEPERQSGQRLESTGQSPERSQRTENMEQEPEMDVERTSSADREVSPSKVNDGEGEGGSRPTESEVVTSPGLSSGEARTPSLFPPTVDKEMKRKVAAAKRANEDTLSSAKERYLARKRAKLTAPIISEDD